MKIKKERELIMTKKRITKRIIAVVVASLMLVAFAIPVTATSGQPNSGKITVHKYSGAGYGYPSDSEFSGEEIVDGTTQHPAENSYTKLSGVGFTLYSLNMSAVNARIADGDIVTGYAANNNVVTFTFGSGTPTTLDVTGVIVGSQETTDGDGKIVFGSPTLADGYYVLVETTPLAGYDAAAPSIIRLPLTSADGQSLNYDVHVYPKNISTTNLVVKKLGDAGAKPITKGDNIPFELLAKFRNTESASDKVSSVNDLKNGTTYGKAQIIDTLHADLVYKNDASVYWMGNDGAFSSTALLSNEYVISSTGTAGAGGRVITVTLTPAGIDKAIAQRYPGFGVKLTADYTGSASAGADVTNITNKMGAIITKAGSTEQPPTEITIYVPQLQIIIDKVADAAGGNKMSGVEFMLLKKLVTPIVNYQSGTSLTDETYTQAQKDAIADQYVLDKNGVPISGVTGADGKLILSNLPGYVDASGAEFWIKETKTREGYQLKTVPIKVTFANKITYKGDSATEHWFNDAGNWLENVTVANTVEIINYAQGEDPDEPIFSLPLTGGAGTIAFTVAGIVVMLGAALLIIRKKKVV